MDAIDNLIADLIANADDRRTHKPPVTPEQVNRAAKDMADRGFLPARGAEAQYRDLATWLAAVSAEKSSRGLFLWGKPGRGKTLFLSRFCPGRQRLTALDIGDAYREKGHAAVMEWLTPERYDTVPYGYYQLAIDDVGTEPTGKRYGETVEIMADVIDLRYRLWSRGGFDWGVFITSNLSPEEMGRRYGARTTSRLAEMCVMIELTGPDWRTL